MLSLKGLVIQGLQDAYRDIEKDVLKNQDFGDGSVRRALIKLYE